MEDLISVIVPIYNVEKYIKKCIDSIVNQTYTNLEIILVDDGSTDQCGQVCDEYAKRDARIKVIHKENGGLSSSRNTGLEKMTGEFVCFIDSDDYIEKDMINFLLKDLKKNNSDISSCGKIIEYYNKVENKNNTEEFVNNPKETLARMLTFNNFDNSFCDKLFKVELFKKEKFPIGSYYEDMAIMYKIVNKAKLISHINFLGYHYIMRENSITNEKFSIKQIDMLRYAEECRDNIIAWHTDLKEEANSFYNMNLTNVMLKIIKDTDRKKYKRELKVLNKKIIKDILPIIRNKLIPIKRKIVSVILCLRLYVIIILKERVKGRKK